MDKKSLTMLQNLKSDEPLKKDIRELGIILGNVLKEQEGIELYETEEKLRALTKSLRTKFSKKTINEITSLIDSLTIEQAYKVVRAFSTYFILVNAADEVHRIRQQRFHLLNSKEPKEGSINNALLQLKNESYSKNKIKKILESIKIVPVFTAHPTEATRQTILRKILKISQLLLKRELRKNTLEEEEKIKAELQITITLLWQSNEIRFHKVTVKDEIQRGLFFFKDVLYETLSEFYSSLNTKLNQTLSYNEFSPALFSFGSWMGGDRDGHPYVTVDLTKETLFNNKKQIIGLYLQDLDPLYISLSTSSNIVKANKKLIKSIKIDSEKLNRRTGQAGLNYSEEILRDPSEVYRSKLLLVSKKLQGVLDNSEFAYKTHFDFLEDLYLIYDSLVENKGKIIAESNILHLIYKVKTFQFHLVETDIRQNISVLKKALNNIFKYSEVHEDFESLSEQEKIHLLTAEILKSRPLKNSFSELSDTAKQVLSELETINWGKKNISENACNDFIISNCSSVSDILTAMLLAKESGLIKVHDKKIAESNFDVLPLFETIMDLRKCHKIMEELFDNQAYSSHIKIRNNIQKIMIGYSDSNKDGGIVTSNFELYKAQKNLKELCDKKKIQLFLFHGRGGSISRGGGPVSQSILAQPPGTIEGKIKITEQGEMISSKYLIPQIAKSSLEIMASSVILATSRSFYKKEKDYIDKYGKVFEQISENAFEKYKRLTEHDGFYEYFRTITPIDIIEHIEIGSRPPSRKKTKDLGSLRAIPWVFSWTQNRQTISGWFGFGYSINKCIKDKIINLDEIKQMYKKWEFFKVLVQNIEMVLMKTDMVIGKEYLSLNNSENAKNIFAIINEEYNLSTKILLKITGEKSLLDHDKSLQRSILLRNPYIDPISFIQVKFIKQYRQKNISKEKKVKLLSLLRSSINGIAAGVRNTG